MTESQGVEASKKKYNIIVNGQHKTVETEVLSFDDVVRLAYPDPGDKIYSVSFERAEEPKAGELVSGQSVEIKDGTEFDVEPTGRS